MAIEIFELDSSWKTERIWTKLSLHNTKIFSASGPQTDWGFKVMVLQIKVTESFLVEAYQLTVRRRTSCYQTRDFLVRRADRIPSLVIKDLVYEAKAKAKTFLLKAKDMKIFQDQKYKRQVHNKNIQKRRLTK